MKEAGDAPASARGHAVGCVERPAQRAAQFTLRAAAADTHEMGRALLLLLLLCAISIHCILGACHGRSHSDFA